MTCCNSWIWGVIEAQPGHLWEVELDFALLARVTTCAGSTGAVVWQHELSSGFRVNPSAGADVKRVVCQSKTSCDSMQAMLYRRRTTLACIQCLANPTQMPPACQPFLHGTKCIACVSVNLG